MGLSTIVRYICLSVSMLFYLMPASFLVNWSYIKKLNWKILLYLAHSYIATYLNKLIYLNASPLPVHNGSFFTYSNVVYLPLATIKLPQGDPAETAIPISIFRDIVVILQSRLNVKTWEKERERNMLLLPAPFMCCGLNQSQLWEEEGNLGTCGGLKSSCFSSIIPLFLSCFTAVLISVLFSLLWLLTFYSCQQSPSYKLKWYVS